MTDEFAFGRWLQQRRLAQGNTQQALAQAVGCAVITLQKLEAGDRRPSVAMASRLADVLGVAAEDRAAFVAFARGQAREPFPPGWRRTADPDDPPRHNLPHTLTPLHGREQELALVTGRLRQGHRLVSLVGAPGVGKTRLALEVAHALRRDFADGVYFVALESIAESGMVIPAIVQALAPQAYGDQDLPGRLAAGLRDRHLLLVLDNFEQLLPAADAVGVLLAACPWLSVLITSRVPLQLHGEVQVELLPLPVPDETTPAERLAQFASAALFIERATAVQADFQVTETNAPVLSQICRRLDGLPLAIELVAGQIKLLPPEELLAQVEAQAGWLLSLTERRALSARQVSLRAAIGASFQLLAADERELLAVLAVFAGGFTREAAEAVAGPEAATLSRLGALRDKSLLQRQSRPDAGAGARFSLLAVVREQALERLARDPARAAVRRRHASYYVGLAEAGAAHLHGPHQVVWFERILLELDNCRSALNWLLENGEPVQATRLVVALTPLWIARGLLEEGRRSAARTMEAAAATAPTFPVHLTVRLDNMQGSLAYYSGDARAAITSFRRALERAAMVGETREMAYALDGLAAVAVAEGRYAEAWRLSEESLALSRSAGDLWLAAITLINLGEIARDRRDLDLATDFFLESLQILRELGDLSFAAVALHDLGQVTFEQGKPEQTTAYLVEALGLAQQVLSYRLIARILERMAEMSLARTRPEDAARLLGAAAELRRAHGIVLQYAEEADRDHVTSAAQAALGPAFDTLQAAGRVLTLQESVRLALAGT